MTRGPSAVRRRPGLAVPRGWVRVVVAMGLVGGALAGRGAVGGPEAGVEVRPYDRRLPDGDVDATIVVDEATGAPVVGARVAMYEEDVDAGETRYDVVVAEQATDRFGVASLEIPDDALRGHFVVVAPGYAPVHEYGRLPAVTRLRRGIRIVARVVDPDDRPVAGARVEAYPADGCPHAPTLATYVTDADGRVVFEDAPDEGWNLWITAAGFATERHGVNGLSGTGAEELVLERGVTLRGRLNDPTGAPLAGVVVRADGFPRGPVTVSSADGTFELAGADPREEVVVVWPRTTSKADEERGVHVRLSPDVAADLPLGDGGLVEPEGTATVTLVVRGPKGADAKPGLGLTWTGPSGVTTRARLPWDDAAGRFQDVLEVPAGAFVVAGDDPLDPCAVVLRRGVVKAGESVTLDLEAVPRVPLRFEGLPEGGADAWIVVRGGPAASAHVGAPKDPDARVPCVDPTASVRVVATARGFYAVAEVGPVVDGVRLARLSPPTERKTTIHLVSKRPYHDVSLGLGPDARYMSVDEGEEPNTFTTEVEGPAWLVVDFDAKDGAPETTRVVPIVLPPRDATPRIVTVNLDGPVEGERATGPVTLALVGPGGAPIAETALDARSLVGSGGLEGREIETPVALDGPCVAWIAPPGLLSVVRRFETPGRHEVVWPSGAITVIVRGADGAPSSGRALLAGTRLDVVAGRAALGGLPAGEHTLVVVSDDGAGATATFTLGDSEARSLAVTLPPPPVDRVTRSTAPFPGDPPPADATGAAAGDTPVSNAASDAVSTVLWDAVTRRPAAGAVLRWYPEDASDAAWQRGILLAEGVADDAGVASVPWSRDEGTAHWVATAPGRAPTHAMGDRPPARMVLDAGRRLAGRVVDPLGRAIANATVDLYLGCGHGPSGALVTTDADGRFTIERAPTDAGYLWVSASRHRGALHVVEHLLETYGGAEARIVLAPAVDVTGTVVDPAGQPLAGCVVRQFQETRGPRAVTDAAGRFTLVGATPGSDASVHHVFTGAWLRIDAVAADRPLNVQLAGFRPALPEPDAFVRVRARDGAGPAADVRVALVGDDGRMHVGWTEDEPMGEGPARVVVGEARVAVPAGRYVVRPADPFAKTSFAPTEVVAVTGREVPVEVVVAAQAPVELSNAPRGTHGYLAGARQAAEGIAGVPADAEVLVVAPDGQGVLLAPPGPDGVRRATLGPRPRRRVTWASDLDVAGARLTFEGFPVAADDDGASLVTDAAGALTLHATVGGRAVVADVVLDPASVAPVAVDLRAARPAPTARVRKPAGATTTVVRPRGVRAVEREPSTDPDGWFDLEFVHGTVVFEAPGRPPLSVAIDGPGPYEPRWGTVGVRLRVVDAGSDPVAGARLVVDGQVYAADDAGRLALDGLEAGPHAVLAMPAGPGAGVVWRFEAADGAVREQRLVLP